MAAHGGEVSRLLVETAHRVPAQKRKPVPDDELIPEYLEGERSLRTSLLPEHVHHLAVGPNDGSTPPRVFKCLLDHDADISFEQLRVGRITDHELPEQLLGVEHGEVAKATCLRAVDETAAQMFFDCGTMRRGGDHDGRL